MKFPRLRFLLPLCGLLVVLPALMAPSGGLPAGPTFNYTNLRTGGTYRINNVPVLKIPGTNTGVGNNTLTVVAGNSNVAVGSSALNLLTTGGANVAMGVEAQERNLTGIGNVAVGHQALKFNQSGDFSVAIGYNTLMANTTGFYNLGAGSNALLANTTGGANVALGAETLQSNVNGDRNVAIGIAALKFNVNGIDNVAIGNGALDANTAGLDNVAVGIGALSGSNVSFNTCVGVLCGQAVNGQNNTAVGYAALSELTATSATDNSLFGLQAGRFITTGDGNIIVGENGNITTGSTNIIIGNNSSILSPTLNGQMSIGDILLGDLSTTALWTPGATGLGTGVAGSINAKNLYINGVPVVTTTYSGGTLRTGSGKYDGATGNQVLNYGILAGAESHTVGTGVYNGTFDTAFTTTPVCVVSADSNAAVRCGINATTTVFTVQCTQTTTLAGTDETHQVMCQGK